MLFPTPEYAAFFVGVFFISWLMVARERAHKALLLLASYAFYAYWDWRFLALLVGVSLFSTLLAMRLQLSTHPRVRRSLLLIGVVGLLSTLAFFKYLVFALTNLLALLNRAGLVSELRVPELALPVGLSFFAFHGISMLVDAYRSEIPVRVRLLDGLLYIAFFPQLVAGPILRAKSFLPQLSEPRANSSLDAGSACVLFLIGLTKKALVANFLATRVVDPVFLAPEHATTVDAALAVYGYAAQIYCDFSGYTDMATASALLLGYRFPQNFAAPYTARSLQDFWRRWHITLSTWLRDYLYVPLGGSRQGPRRTAINLFITMTLGGLWHGAGATFIVWGALHGAGLVTERAFAALKLAWLQRLRASAMWRVVGWSLTFHFVVLGWVLFRASSLDVAGAVLKALLNPGASAQHLGASVAGVIAVALAAQWAPERWASRIVGGWERLPLVAQGAALAAGVVVIEALGPSGVWPFIYFQF